ncbi:hypothetical protein RRG08_058514 [Elysia crispata]|uniref:Uncharacterized protein n=1 Tax=Elysia crispata TaxID=231223 RepID=A0AAE0ZWF4_9GAST|nr:hypothetical protein RRG08_058514 [Elysia crispata]
MQTPTAMYTDRLHNRPVIEDRLDVFGGEKIRTAWTRQTIPRVNIGNTARIKAKGTFSSELPPVIVTTLALCNVRFPARNTCSDVTVECHKNCLRLVRLQISLFGQRGDTGVVTRDQALETDPDNQPPAGLLWCVVSDVVRTTISVCHIDLRWRGGYPWLENPGRLWRLYSPRWECLLWPSHRSNLGVFPMRAPRPITAGLNTELLKEDGLGSSLGEVKPPTSAAVDATAVCDVCMWRVNRNI